MRPPGRLAWSNLLVDADLAGPGTAPSAPTSS